MILLYWRFVSMSDADGTAWRQTAMNVSPAIDEQAGRRVRAARHYDDRWCAAPPDSQVHNYNKTLLYANAKYTSITLFVTMRS